MNPPAKTSRNPWPIAIASYLGAFIVFTIGMVAYLSHQKMDLVQVDYYDDEIRYQTQLDRLNRTASLNSQVLVAYDAAHKDISIVLPNGKAQVDLSGRIRLYRPSDQSLDKEYKLEIGPDGVQHVDASALPAGRWKVRIYWTVSGQDYYFSQNVTLGTKLS